MAIQFHSNQRTITSEVSFGGKALQTGREVSVRLKPALRDAGIVFKRLDIPRSGDVKLSGEALSGEHKRRTTIGKGGAQVQTIEHFLAALWCLGIDNIRVEVSGPEMPALDGSAKDFISEIKKSGIRDLGVPSRAIKIEEPVEIKEKGRSLSIYPDDKFSVSYLIDYPVKSIGREVFSSELDGPFFEKEIASARTFCLRKEVDLLLKLGFGKGATFDNNLVMDEAGPVGTTLRFPNEPLRHKILDLVGDLYMLGVPVIGRVVAEKSGHGLNAKLVRKIHERYIKKDGKKEVFGSVLGYLYSALNKRKGA